MVMNHFDYIRAIGSDKDEIPADRQHHLRPDDYYTGKITGTLHTLTPIHVGTGQLMRPDDIQPQPNGYKQFSLVAPFFRGIDENGTVKRVIPGSSWRGVVRSLVETITDSGFAAALEPPRRGGVSVPSDLKDNRFSDKAQKQGNNPDFDPASQIFGGQGYKSHVSFQDLICDSGDAWDVLLLKDRWQPKIRSADERKIYLHLSQPEYGNEVLEICPAGVNWTFEIGFHNLTEAQVGLLLIALGQDGKLYPKLGGGKGQGIGSVDVRDVAVWRDPGAETMLLIFDGDERQRLDDVQELIVEGRTLLNVNAYQQLCNLIGQFPGKER